MLLSAVYFGIVLPEASAKVSRALTLCSVQLLRWDFMKVSSKSHLDVDSLKAEFPGSDFPCFSLISLKVKSFSLRKREANGERNQVRDEKFNGRRGGVLSTARLRSLATEQWGVCL